MTGYRQASPGPARMSEGMCAMGIGDKAENTAEGMAGKAKEATGKATGDESMENEGKVDQSKSDLKQAGEKVKDAFKD